MTNIHLICAADLHLGRRVGPKKHRSFSIQAWERLVETCLLQQVDGLLLAGDLIDQDGIFIEMAGVLRKGILKLHAQGIFVAAIAGNHDANVLDQYAQSLKGISNFFLLGKNGQWERKSFFVRERKIHLEGISFTQSSSFENPFCSYKKEPVSAGDALVGLVHCDVDNIGSKHAPVRSSDFLGLPHHAWILGHIHVAKEVSKEKPWVQYCGSLQGLDIGLTECGAKGAWKLTIPPHGPVETKFLPLAPLRWEQVPIDCGFITHPNWESQILKKIEETIAHQIRCAKGIDLVGVRLKFKGHTPIYHELRENLSRLQQQQEAGLILENRWVSVFYESIENHTRPKLDIPLLAEGKTMSALLAKKILLATENPDLSKCIYHRIQKKFLADPYLRRCESAWPNESECLELYIQEGYAILEHVQNEIKKGIDV